MQSIEIFNNFKDLIMGKTLVMFILLTHDMSILLIIKCCKCELELLILLNILGRYLVHVKVVVKNLISYLASLKIILLKVGL